MEKEVIKESVLNAFHFRHACKVFDENKKISDTDMAYILETGRLSPSSFGMQGWRMLVITDPGVRARLKKECWNQVQIDTSSHLVVFVTRTKELEPGNDWVKSRFADRGMPAEAQAAYYERYAGFHQNLKTRLKGFFTRSIVGIFYGLFHSCRKPGDLYEWASKQCYIPLGNMMTAAAMIGIDSCPLEGFDKNAVEKVLELDTSREEVVVLCAFGYRKNDQPEKKRLPLDIYVERR